MKKLDEIISSPRPMKQAGFTHADSKFLLKIPHEIRSSQANEILLKQHTKLAYNVAIKIWKKYQGKICSVLEFEDLLSAANEGLMVALKRYNPAFNTEFSTFAVHWIRQKTQREVDSNYSPVRIPIHFVQTTRQVVGGSDRKSSKELNLVHLTLHRFSPNISVDIGIPEDDVTVKDMLTYDHMKYLYNESTFSDPEKVVLLSDLRNRIEALIKTLPKTRNQEILRRRFGLDDYGGERTLQEVGKQFHVTRERIRQVCETGFKRIQINKFVDQSDLAE